MGGRELISLNTAIAMLITEGYHYRVITAAWNALPLDSESWAYVTECADELGITTAEALRILIRRGAPHQPQKGCLTPAARPKAVPPERLPTTPPVSPAGRPEAPNGPRYATPKPAALPPVPPVPGQVPLEGDTA